MNNLLDIKVEHIQQLNAEQLTTLLNELLRLEARKYGIPESCISVGSNISAPDGGIDGIVKWDDLCCRTNFLPSRNCVFQVKAVKRFSPYNVKNEILSKGEIKPTLDAVFSAGAAYILFINLSKNPNLKQNLINEYRAVLIKQNKPYAKSASIDVYDSQTITNWVKRFFAAILSVRAWIGEPIPKGIKSWKEWRNASEHQTTQFVADDARENALVAIREQLSEERKSMRIIGLSGLGKSRLALEAFDSCEGEELRGSVVYIDTQECRGFEPGDVRTWIQQGYGGILVVDNCELELHYLLERMVAEDQSAFSLLTLHYETGELHGGTNTLILKRMDDRFIEMILKQQYEKQIPDLHRVVSFAQGFPLIAFLVAEARITHDPNIGRLDNQMILDRLLGESAGDDKRRWILRAASLFDVLGWEGAVAEEYKFVATPFGRSEPDEFFECIVGHRQRGIIHAAGRYVQVTPKPLAIQLAAEWFENTRPERISELLNQRMPGQLVESFCRQVSMLDFLPEAKELAADLCGIQGPFGQAEVILTVRGSRLFRAFAEVNPEVICGSIYHVLSQLTDQELLGIVHDTRRNLVIALEKLNCRKETFKKSAWSLMLLAKNENESWVNNATELFKQLFRIRLSGTEAPPTTRLQLLDSILEGESESAKVLVVDALCAALDTRGYSRFVGAEWQGSGTVLEEWQPSTTQEVFDYWVAVIERLATLASTDTELGSHARKGLGESIRSVVFQSDIVVDSLDDAIRQVVEATPLWIDALEDVTEALEYKPSNATEYALEKLRDWKQLLQPRKLADKLTLFVTSPFHHHLKTDDDQYVDEAELNVEKLAEEVSNDIKALIPHLPHLLSTSQRQGSRFGEALVARSDEWRIVFDPAIHFVKRNTDSYTEFLCGMLIGVHEREPDTWKHYLTEFSQDPALNEYWLEFATTGLLEDFHFDVLMNMLVRGVLDVERLGVLSRSKHFVKVSSEVLKTFIAGVSEHSSRAQWTALELVTIYCDRNETYANFHDTLSQLTLSVLSYWNDETHTPIQESDWKHAVKKALSWEDQEGFAVELAKKVMKLVGENPFRYDSGVFDAVVREALELYPTDTWTEITSVVEESNERERDTLARFLRGVDELERENRVSLYTSVPEELITEWCEKATEVGPVFIASTTQPYQRNEGQVSLSPMAEYLIDNFGDSDSVVGALESNMIALVWAGSHAATLGQEIEILEPLVEHRQANVRTWAENRISNLKEQVAASEQLEEEESVGIFD